MPGIPSKDASFVIWAVKNIASIKIFCIYLLLAILNEVCGGCFETVKGLRIAELRRPMNSQVVTVIRFTWNGHERILDVQ